MERERAGGQDDTSAGFKAMKTLEKSQLIKPASPPLKEQLLLRLLAGGESVVLKRTSAERRTELRLSLSMVLEISPCSGSLEVYN
ncbi:hypothetical protein PAMA_011371 [Pampus argenteus]